ncbi:MAG: hypothetical protein ACLUGQ_10230 [Coprococcus sp.]
MKQPQRRQQQEAATTTDRLTVYRYCQLSHGADDRMKMRITRQEIAPLDNVRPISG